MYAATKYPTDPLQFVNKYYFQVKSTWNDESYKTIIVIMLFMTVLPLTLMLGISPLAALHIYSLVIRAIKTNKIILGLHQGSFIYSGVVSTEPRKESQDKKVLHMRPLILTNVGICIGFLIVHISSILHFIQYGDEVLSSDDYMPIVITHAIISLLAIVIGFVLTVIILAIRIRKQREMATNDQMTATHKQRARTYNQRATAHDQRTTIHDQRAAAHDQMVTSHDHRATTCDQTAITHNQMAITHNQTATTHDQRATTQPKGIKIQLEDNDTQQLLIPAALISINLLYIGCYFMPYMLLAFIHDPVLTIFTYLMVVFFFACIYLICLGVWNLYKNKDKVLSTACDMDKCKNMLNVILYSCMVWAIAFSVIIFLFVINYIITLGGFDDFEELKNLLPSLLIAVLGFLLLKPAYKFVSKRFQGNSSNDNREVATE